MCHSCASRNPGYFVLASVFLLGKWELDDIFWIPAFAGMTPPNFASLEPFSPTAGEAICFIRLNSYGNCNMGNILAEWRAQSVIRKQQSRLIPTLAGTPRQYGVLLSGFPLARE